MPTKDELLKRKADAEAKLKAKTEADELKKLEDETKALESQIEVIEPGLERTTIAQRDAAKEGNFEKFLEINNDRFAKLHEDDVKKFEAKRAATDLKFSAKAIKMVEKAVGSAKRDEVLAFAKDYEKHVSELSFVAHMMRKDIHELRRFKDQFGDSFGKKEVEIATKALSLGGSGTGAEYVLTGWTDQVAMRLMDENHALANLPVIDQPYNPYRLPIYTAVPTTYYVTEGSTVGSSDPTTSNKDLDAKKLMNRVVYSGEIEEDSIVAIRPFAERVMMESLGNAIERSILFGDIDATANTNINLINGTPTTTAGSADSYLAIDGLIRETFRTNGKTTDINSDIVAGFGSVMQKMGVGAANPRDLVCFMNVELLYKFMANSSFKTWDGLGNALTLLNGAPGVIFGVPVFGSSGIPKTNSAGKIPSGGGTLGSLVVVKKSGIVVGFMRRPRLDANDILQAADQKAWVASARLALKVIQPNASDRAAVSYGYNAGL